MALNYKDINIKLTRMTSGDIKVDKNLDAIENSIKNILSTLQGSRRMLPRFAESLQSLLFEPIDEATAFSIGDRILSAIETWDDRIVLENITVQPKADQHIYLININYRIREEQTELREFKYILKQT